MLGFFLNEKDINLFFFNQLLFLDFPGVTLENEEYIFKSCFVWMNG